MQRVYIHSYFTLVDFWALESIFVNLDEFVILTPLGGNLEWIWDILSPIWPPGYKLENNYKSGLQVQKVYIHSDFTLVDFWPLGKHIFFNISDFVNLPPLGLYS